MIAFGLCVNGPALLFGSGESEDAEMDDRDEAIEVINATIAVAPPDSTHLAGEARTRFETCTVPRGLLVCRKI